MICNLCRCPAELRRDGDYASHNNADGVHCDATGTNPDEALAKRRTFRDKGQSPAEIILSDDGNGVTVRAVSTHHSAKSFIWVGIAATDARRMAAVLIELADAVETREG